MAHFDNSIDYRTVCGEFNNGFARFEYRPNTRPDLSDMPFEIAMSDGSFRFAKVLKTVVYIAVDEDENGPVIEKWDVKANFNCCSIHGMLPDDIDDGSF
jgi:hypothetical protein